MSSWLPRSWIADVVGMSNQVDASFTVTGLVAENIIVLEAKDLHKRVKILGWGAASPGGSRYFVDERMT
jgi:hypothetical protein